MKQETLKITNILVGESVARQIFALIGRTSTDKPLADMARRVTALANTKAGRWIDTIKPLGAPPTGVLIPVAGQYNEFEVRVIRAALKRIAKKVFSVDEASLSGAVAQMTRVKIASPDARDKFVATHAYRAHKMQMGMTGRSSLEGARAMLSRLKSLRSRLSFHALNRPALIAGRVALYGFAAFGVFATAAMLLQPKAAQMQSAVNKDAQDYRDMEASLAQASQVQPSPQSVQQKPLVAPPREIEIVTGKADLPQHRFYVFSDPLCPYCKEFEPVLEKVAAKKGFEMHLFPTPLHDGARALVSQIACAKNRGLAWHESITKEQVNDAVVCSAGESAPSRAIEFFHSINLEGTPTVINESGFVHSGGFSSEEDMIKFLDKQD